MIEQDELTLHDVDVAKAEESATTVVHPTALVDRRAELGRGVHVGPYAIVGRGVRLGDGVRVDSHCVIEGRTTVGAHSVVYPFVVLGALPQDLKYKGESAELIIGEENSIRQYSNFSIGTASGGGKTVVGRRNLFMVNVHVAHDCVIGDNAVFANNATLAGHVEVQSRAFLGGLCAVHQFCKIGTMAMIAGGSMVTQDVTPYTMVQGDRATPNGLNVVGLRRAGYAADLVRDFKTMYRLVYSESLTLDDAVARILAEVPESEERTHFVAFLKASKRGLCR